MNRLIAVLATILFVYSTSLFAVTGNGTGGNVAVTGGGTGGSVTVTGGGTGGSTEVTGNGTGVAVEVTGGGTGSPQAVSVDACMSGSYYDPEAPGEGINVEVLTDQIVVYFYRADGLWFFLQGDDSGLEAYQPYAGEVFDVGRGVFVPVDNDTVVFGYDLLLDATQVSPTRPIPWCLHWDCEYEKVLTRLTQPIPCASEVAVTGGGTGVQVTGNGTGSGTQVTGNGTGSSTQVTGGGTGGSAQVTGGGTGSE